MKSILYLALMILFLGSLAGAFLDLSLAQVLEAAPALAPATTEPGFIELLSQSLPTWAVLAILGAFAAVNAIGKRIPDEATAPLAVFVRRLAKVLTLYVPNRVAPAEPHQRNPK